MEHDSTGEVYVYRSTISLLVPVARSKYMVSIVCCDRAISTYGTEQWIPEPFIHSSTVMSHYIVHPADVREIIEMSSPPKFSNVMTVQYLYITRALST